MNLIFPLRARRRISDDIRADLKSSGFEIKWLLRDRGDELVATTQGLANIQDAYHWFAAHKDEARAMRKFYRQTLKLTPDAYECVAYWR